MAEEEKIAVEFNADDFIVKNVSRFLVLLMRGFFLQAPATVCYIPDFITEDEEEQLLDDVIERTSKPKWRTLPSQRRCANYGGLVGKHALIVADDIPSVSAVGC